MTIALTRHEVGYRDAIGPQLDDAITVADGAVSAALTGGFYIVRATGDCTVRFGPAGLADAADGEIWKADDIMTRVVPDGYVVAVDAAA